MNHISDKPVLGSPKTATELLDLYFLEARSALLETAAIFDRIERGEGGTEAFSDPRLSKLLAACNLLRDGKANRAEQFLLLFSDPAD
jgi:hypothetical protein